MVLRTDFQMKNSEKVSSCGRISVQTGATDGNCLFRSLIMLVKDKSQDNK